MHFLFDQKAMKSKPNSTVYLYLEYMEFSSFAYKCKANPVPSEYSGIAFHMHIFLSTVKFTNVILAAYARNCATSKHRK